MIRVALFGTSADPPTAGHEEILRWLSQHYDWVAVWAADNPFKSHQALLEHRAAMLDLMIAAIDSPKRNISLEQDLSRLRTIETVEQARIRWGDDVEFTLVVGSDLLTQLPKWYRIQDLLMQVRLLVIPRPGYTINNSTLQPVQKLGGKVAIAEMVGLDVSSTAYRTHRDENTLTPPVVAYINQEHLYKCQDETQKRLQMH
jgi:nicotinate-nucleotide adenylyltransferase